MILVKLVTMGNGRVLVMATWVPLLLLACMTQLSLQSRTKLDVGLRDDEWQQKQQQCSSVSDCKYFVYSSSSADDAPGSSSCRHGQCIGGRYGCSNATSGGTALHNRMNTDAVTPTDDINNYTGCNKGGHCGTDRDCRKQCPKHCTLTCSCGQCLCGC